jgi:hypothetical protein
MNPWKRLHNEFKALMEEEDRMIQQGEPKNRCYAYVTEGASGSLTVGSRTAQRRV